MNSTKIQHAYNQIIESIKADSRSDAEISRQSGVSQPTVWRLRSGHKPRLRYSEQFNKLCTFYGVNELAAPLGHGSLETELKDALMSVWDGSDAHARALIKVVRSLKGLAANSVGQSVPLSAHGGRNAGHSN